MPSITSLIKNLKIDFPNIKFEPSSCFLWSHNEQTVYYDSSSNNCGFLLHELSHALLDHTVYSRDIELITMERKAWDKSKELALNYKVTIDEDFIQSNLDTYRDWLHSRSICPKCKASGLQINKNIYSCLVCSNEWKVNEARTCALRRYRLKK
ncbi:MAG: hypothetical protein WCK26_01600 [Candidatus Saccharibacteria bacterium]